MATCCHLSAALAITLLVSAVSAASADVDFSADVDTFDAVASAVDSAVFDANAADCPSPAWIPAYNNFCYLLVNNTWPWYVTEDACSQVAAPGSRLVSVHDVQLNAFIAETVAGGDEAWLGLRRATTYDEWVWSDGTAFDFSYWYQGEPSGGGELCALTNCGRVGEWCAKSCHDYNSVFVCEIEAGGPTTTPPPGPTTTEPTSTVSTTTSGFVDGGLER